MQTAVSHVEKNIGECVAIHKWSDGVYVALAFRENAPFSDRPYSTHNVFDRGCESGHYDMSYLEALGDFKLRAGVA